MVPGISEASEKIDRGLAQSAAAELELKSQFQGFALLYGLKLVHTLGTQMKRIGIFIFNGTKYTTCFRTFPQINTYSGNCWLRFCQTGFCTFINDRKTTKKADLFRKWKS